MYSSTWNPCVLLHLSLNEPDFVRKTKGEVLTIATVYPGPHFWILDLAIFSKAISVIMPKARKTPFTNHPLKICIACKNQDFPAGKVIWNRRDQSGICIKKGTQEHLTGLSAWCSRVPRIYFFPYLISARIKHATCPVHSSLNTGNLALTGP